MQSTIFSCCKRAVFVAGKRLGGLSISACFRGLLGDAPDVDGSSVDGGVNLPVLSLR